MSGSATHRWVAWAALATAGCTPPHQPDAPPNAPTPQQPHNAATALPQVLPQDGSAPARPSTAAATRRIPAVQEVTIEFERALDVPIRSIAAGKQRVAALGERGQAFLFDGAGWQPIPIPDRLWRRAGVLSVYLGRDDRPRVMGYRETDQGQYPVYLRYKDGWRTQYDEIARLGGERPGRLYGELGWDDPEVVCRDDEPCIAKRVTGWTAIENPGYSRMRLAGGQVWAWGAWGTAHLAGTTWVSLPPGLPASAILDVWGPVPEEAWALLGAGKERLWRYSSGRWTPTYPPLDTPRALWGPEDDTVWLVGEDGIARFKQGSWQRVRGVQAALDCIIGRSSGEVWVGGTTGLWRSVGTEP